LWGEAAAAHASNAGAKGNKINIGLTNKYVL